MDEWKELRADFCVDGWTTLKPSLHGIWRGAGEPVGEDTGDFWVRDSANCADREWDFEGGLEGEELRCGLEGSGIGVEEKIDTLLTAEVRLKPLMIDL